VDETEGYEDTLKRLDGDAESAQAIADAFRTAAANIRTALKKKKAASVSSLPLFTGITVPHHGNGKSPLAKDATMEDVAKFAIKTVGRPLRVREIWDIATASGWVYRGGNYKSYRGSMAPTLSRNPAFRSSGPLGSGLYELVEEIEVG
jgi:hypothetical protein